MNEIETAPELGDAVLEGRRSYERFSIIVAPHETKPLES